MAEYDGHIRIDTKIDDKGLVNGIREMSSKTLRLSNQIKQTEIEIRNLQKEMVELSKTPIDVKEFDRLKGKISETESALDKLYETRGMLENDLVDADMAKVSTPEMIQKIYAMSSEWKKLTGEIEKAEESLGQYNARLNEAKTTETQADTPLFEKKAVQIEKLTGKLDVLKQQLAESEQREKGVYSGFEKIKNTLSGLGKQSTKTFKRMNSDVKKTDTALGYFGKRIKGLLSSLLVFNVISTAFRKMTQAMSDGIKEFAKHNADFNKSMSALKSSLSTLRNSFGSAFAPIIQTAIPSLVKLIEYVTKAVNALGQLFAALTGKKVFYKAIEVQEDYAGALEDTKEAADDAKKSLAPFDELNVQSSNKSAASGGTSGGGYVEVPIDEEVLKWADKLKDILSKLFAPMKKAWQKEGKFVMDSWKYALKEVSNLLSDIGRDFLIMWNQDETVKMFEDILHIIGDIGLVVGNLARQFDVAWNKNNTGLHILENIRDIFAVIVENIREAADYTVDWADKLDFSPILEGFEELTASLVPFADFVSGTLSDFYTEFILPLTKFAVESGIPQLEKILANFFNNVDWEALRNALKNLYQALEPYAEGFAQGLIDFFEDLMGIGTTFMNSLADPINDIADALKNGDPDKARELGYAFAQVAVGLKALKLAMAGFTGIKSLLDLIDKVGGWKNVGALGAYGLFAYSASQVGPGTSYEFDFNKTYDENKEEWDKYSKDHPLSFSAEFGFGDSKYEAENLWNTSLLPIVEDFKKWQEENRKTREKESEELGIWADSLSEKFSQIKENLSTAWNETWENISTTFTTKWGELTEWFDTTIAPWFTAEKWNEILEGVQTAFEEKFEDIKEKLSGKWDEIHKKITDVWEKIQEFFKDKFENLKESAEDLGKKFSDFRDKVVDAFESIKSKIKPIVDWIMDKVEAIGSAVSGAFGKLSGWGSSILGRASSAFSSASFTPTTYSMPTPLSGINLTSLPIPALATGTVIPPGMSQFLAVLGDNNREAEVVSPISYIENAVGKEMEKAMQKFMGQNGKFSVNLIIQGDAERFMEVMIEENGKYKKQHGGRSAFES